MRRLIFYSLFVAASLSIIASAQTAVDGTLRDMSGKSVAQGKAVLQRAEGSVVLAAGEEFSVAAVPVERVVDTTGAGDLYAAGFLYGLTRGLPLPKCGAIGSLCAAEIISHVGARPEAALSGLVKAAGLL